MIGRHSDITFPAIDFKFQNTGGSTAILWQYAVEVLEAEIDPTPVPKFRLITDSTSFAVKVVNNGWGPANDCTFLLTHPLLNRLFSEPTRRFVGTVANGEEKTLFSFPMSSEQFLKEHQRLYKESEEVFNSSLSDEVRKTLYRAFPPYRLEDLMDQWRRSDRRVNPRLREKVEKWLRTEFESKWFLNPYSRDLETAYILSAMRAADLSVKLGSNNAIPIAVINHPQLTWECSDERNTRLSGDEVISGFLYMSSVGFFYEAAVRCGAAMDHGPTFCSVIDPALGPHVLTYPISRMIPPGEAERFHIVVGATRSCSMRVRFKFAVDKSKVIESKIFNIEIWNPRQSSFELDYIDGKSFQKLII